jgi:hypothetical protein
VLVEHAASGKSIEETIKRRLQSRRTYIYTIEQTIELKNQKPWAVACDWLQRVATHTLPSQSLISNVQSTKMKYWITEIRSSFGSTLEMNCTYFLHDITTERKTRQIFQSRKLFLQFHNSISAFLHQFVS